MSSKTMNRDNSTSGMTKPEIMAPAGDRDSFLAALAAEADAIYLGLKHFSARMQAQNFSISELARLANLAREQGVKVYVAMNTLVKPGDEDAAGRLIDRAARSVRPDALIVQDPGMFLLARQAGFQGELHLSTLGNLSHPAGLRIARELGADRVVIPRELSLDEARTMAEACPEDLDLEIFVHGALCYSVSGRCWWSSYMGGKSGLRGRCVQPCRRLYRHEKSDQGRRAFSCMDLSLDILTKPLLDLPKINAWKIEGRKKGPHYVYYTVKAYRLLRDRPKDAQAKKDALSLLEQALGRPGTHSAFLPQRAFTPVQPDKDTGSGLFVGPVKTLNRRPYLNPRMDLLPGDLLRVGYEDETGHRVLPVRKRVPKGGRLDLPPGRGPAASAGMRVFLIDRREPGLISELRRLEKALAAQPEIAAPEASSFMPRPLPPAKPEKTRQISLMRNPPKGRIQDMTGFWLEQRLLETLPRALHRQVWWWLPPVIWPNEEERWAGMVQSALNLGAQTLVLNAPWQAGLVPKGAARLVAGPFCNISNGYAVQALAELGFSGAFVSPELSKDEFLRLPAESPLPLGVVLKGLWPLGISRVLGEGVKIGEAYNSPKGETCWVKPLGQNYWIYPNWELDLSAEARMLERAGYAWLLTIREHLPKRVRASDRSSKFNWDLTLL
ncbi:MAG: U32 family peptidase [Desulfovibrio sp.]